MTGPVLIAADPLAEFRGWLNAMTDDELLALFPGAERFARLLARDCEEMRDAAQVEGREPEAATG